MYQANVETQTKIKAYKDKSGLWGQQSCWAEVPKFSYASVRVQGHLHGPKDNQKVKRFNSQLLQQAQRKL